MSSSSGPPPPRAGFRPQAARDVSSLHPVFFTERLLRRSPFAPAAAAAGTSPVAHGYAYHQAARRRSGGGAAVARL
ncbi:hypothetical protein DL766_006850 [Monosporascus sp. MC13-8B]|uniref:Uncharacterized protein n=1 Tax=Monosporascus cannonballus TaxID=155416 RepID=A0ABY0GV01_9PEZI|nr:hypothetical protein DL762_010566 [Monosporascus cannonballus]RYO82711.1 hypothetical protein DL763_008166 [Monosporascus cannonballus]RYP25968.1 hypothetical protein DL766_006850 [Monosporascus sp. MC13-8B]